ncbi:MAG TPA: PAS domain S-box protein [Gaiellaceae bacterium]|nr:PAS domain S-box protein [Gaiellaceae bacterium]
MSVQAVAERSGWQSRRVRRLPPSGTAYVAVTSAVALLAAGALATELEPTRAQWIAFALLLPLTTLAPLFRVAVGRNYSLHTGPAFIVAGALVLPPALLVALVVALHAPQWVRERYPWYIHLFNIGNYTLSALAAWLTVDAVGGGDGLRFALSGLAAAGAFVLVNHSLLAVMLRLGRGHGFRESGLFSASGLGVELVVAGLGVALGAFAYLNPWLLPALVAPLVLAHRSVSTLALLRESEERFRTMFESAPTAILLLGLDGRILAVNRSAETLLAYDADELLGMSTPELRHPDDAEEVAGLLATLARGDRDTVRLETRYVRKDGATVVTHLGAALIRDADGRPDYVIAMAEDVTEQRQLEERLRQSQKLEAVGRLAGGVAHDFNNMLTAIGGYTDFALEHAAAGSPLRSDLDEIRKATDRATLLTRQLLAFSRKQVLKPELLNLNGIVLELQSMLRPLIGEDVVITTQLDPALGPIEADPGQLHQVVMNLVVNARDAMPEGGRVSIETANADVDGDGADDDAIEPGRYITLTVRDAGEGMDEQTLAQIFEPFFTTKESAKGTGLGLATVYGIVKQSGGYVAVESELGAGSAFTIYLRRADEARLPAPEPASAVPRRTEPEEVAGRAVVLVVEDEEVVRGLVHQVLAGDGHEVFLAAGGEEAAELARSRRIDVLVTDLTMPGLGGRELAERLRAADPQLRVVFMSGYAEGAYGPEALPPRTAFLQKPFTFGELTGIVRDLLAVN